MFWWFDKNVIERIIDLGLVWGKEKIPLNDQPNVTRRRESINWVKFVQTLTFQQLVHTVEHHKFGIIKF